MNKKSSSFFRLDEQVFFTMGGLCVLSLIIMAFRFVTSTPCSPVQIQVNSKLLIAGNLIRFNAETVQGKTFSWNFGDGATKDEETSVTNHEYKNAGRYTITVMVNGQCTDMQDINIGDAPVIVNTNLQPIISTDATGDTAYVNEPIHFSDISTASTKWEWRFGQTSIIDATDRNPTYVYTVPGRKTVKLKINDRNDIVAQYSLMVIDKVAEKAAATALARPKIEHQVPIVIMPAKPNSDPLKPVQPDVKEEAKAKAPAVTMAQLDGLVRGVCDGSKSAADFYPYMCGNKTIQVVYNSSVMSLEKMCEELKDVKAKKIKSLNIIPTITDNCLNSMNVTLKKKGLFGL